MSKLARLVLAERAAARWFIFGKPQPPWAFAARRAPRAVGGGFGAERGEDLGRHCPCDQHISAEIASSSDTKVEIER